MKITDRSVFPALGGIGLTLVIFAVATSSPDRLAAQPAATPTPFHEGIPGPAATPSDDRGYMMPLPQDLDTANSMTDAGIAMIQAGQSMEAAAAVMASSGNPTLVDLGEHWSQDARALRDQGAWMIVTATSDSMVHDPDKAHELNLLNLQANGAAMEADGQAMADHGRAMVAQVDQLRRDGGLPAATADDLTARGNDLITTGDQMARDGEQMQDDAERLLRSLGE